MDLELESSSKIIQVRKGRVCFSNQPRWFVNCNLVFGILHVQKVCQSLHRLYFSKQVQNYCFLYIS